MTDIREIANKILADQSYKHNRGTYYRDMVEAMTISLRNAVEPHDDEWNERERQFEEMREKYGSDTITIWANILGKIAVMMTRERSDYLGQIYMSLEVGNRSSGQFFTPYHVSQLMAAMTYTKSIEKRIEEQGYITVSEPTCGSGGMILAMADELERRGHDPSSTMIATMQDIDRNCVNMAYVQMRLAGLAAVVIEGDTLMMEERRVLMTPGYVRHSAGQQEQQQKAA